MKRKLIVILLSVFVLSACVFEAPTPADTLVTTQTDYPTEHIELQRVKLRIHLLRNAILEGNGKEKEFFSSKSPHIRELEELELTAADVFKVELPTKEVMVLSDNRTDDEQNYYLFTVENGRWVLYAFGPVEFFGDPKIFSEFMLSER